MSQYDGSIRINTEISTKNAQVQLSSLENRMVKTADKVASLRSKMDALKDAKIPTQEYSEISAQIEKAEQKFNKLLEKQEQMQREGKDNGAAWDRLNYQIEEVGNEIFYAKGELQELVATGKAFTLGSNTEEYAKLGQQLQYAENELSVLNQKHEVLRLKQEKASEGYKKLGNTAKKSFEKINKSAKKSGGLMKTFATRLKGIALSLLVFNWITKAFNAVVKSIKEGFQNLYKDNENFKNSVDSLKASALTLKNTFASAFAPLVQIAIPYIQKLITYLTQLLDKFAQFTALISGQKTYKKAIEQTAEATKEAEKAAEGYLSPLDEINKYQNKDSTDQSTAGTMFEEVPIDPKLASFLDKFKNMLNPIIDYAQKLKDIFMQGFWDGLGDWEYRWNSIKDSIASIKDSLIDIFTDPAVLAAADKWVQSVVYLLGSIVGSLASIGLTIATNLVGGISKYLEQNKDRIKKYLISMFDIWTEIDYMLADFFNSFAFVFEAFASEQGQQLTANIIGMFTDAFMGASELASKFAREVINIITKPFIENKEGFRTALEGFLGVLSEVTETIKQGIDETFDKLNEVYDAHFKPFFDSIAQGLSDIVGKFLEFWNGTVQPILEEWAAKFDTLWKEHIQPFLNSVAELLGSVADLLKTLWEQVIQPFIQWIIDNVLPVLMPIIQSIYDTLVTIIGGIADLLTGFVNTVKGIIDLIVALINGDWSAAWEAAKGIVENIFNMIFSFMQTIWNSIIGVINTALQTVLSIFEVVFQGIYDFVSKIWNDIKEYTTSFFEWIGGHIDSALNDIKDIWDNIWNSFLDTVSNIWENIKSVVSNAVDRIKGMVSKVTSFFSGGGFSGGSDSLTTRTVFVRSQVLSDLSDIDIPGYATGQVIPRTMKKHLAYLGDNNRETEVVSPLSTIEQAVENVMAKINFAGGSGQELVIRVPVILDGKQITEIVVNNGKIQQMSTGNNPFLLGTT